MVVAVATALKHEAPQTDVAIELGGEDAKIIFFDGVGVDERMNGTCAGGTGAFIDQMATLLDVTADELDEMSLKAERTYPIASRCGVFAKTDLQPLLNQGANKADVAASIFQAVVNQTIAGLAQGRRIGRDKDGNEIELSNLCQEEDSRTSRADREAIDSVLGQRANDEELRRSFLFEDENGDLIEDEEEDDSFFDAGEEEDSFFAAAEELIDSDYED